MGGGGRRTSRAAPLRAHAKGVSRLRSVGAVDFRMFHSTRGEAGSGAVFGGRPALRIGLRFVTDLSRFGVGPWLIGIFRGCASGSLGIRTVNHAISERRRDVLFVEGFRQTYTSE